MDTFRDLRKKSITNLIQQKQNKLSETFVSKIIESRFDLSDVSVAIDSTTEEFIKFSNNPENTENLKIPCD